MLGVSRMTRQPDARGAGNAPPLVGRYGDNSVVHAPPGLNLDEGNHIAPHGDQIDFA